MRKIIRADSVQKAVKILREGILLTEEGKSIKAIPKLKKSLQLLQETKNEEMLALCYSFLGLAYRNEKQYNEALQEFNNFLKIITELNDNFGIAQAYLDIGLTLSLQKKYDESINMMMKSLHIIQNQLKDKDLEVTVLANLGGTYLLKGDLDSALSFYKIGIKIANITDFIEGSSECYRGLAEIHAKKGNLKEAETYYHKSLGLFRLLGDKRSESDLLLQLGVLYSQLGLYNDALFYFKQALKLKKQLKDLVGEKLCEKNIDSLQEKIKVKKPTNKSGNRQG
ncbi:MAG: tetratricopeptide repeat protein [Candidatus Helarchaeota archaeon]